MRVLLDTHAFLWWIQDSDRLSKRARAIMRSKENCLLLSIASIWEITIKISLDRLALSDPSLAFIQSQLHHNAIDLLPIGLDHAWAIQALPPYHNDPFDRMLIAQAQIEKIPILSCDKLFKNYAIERIW